MHADIPSLILDIYNIMDTETCGIDSQSTERANLAFLVKHTEKVQNIFINCIIFVKSNFLQFNIFKIK